MSLLDFIKPKWANSNPAVRLGAVSALKDQVILARIAASDVIEDVRVAAIEKLGNKNVLVAIAKEACEKPARAAIARLEDPDLLAEVVAKGDNETVRLAALGKISDERLVAELAKKCIWIETASIACERVADQSLLADIALTAKRVEIRMAALARLGDLSARRKIGEHALQVLREATDRDEVPWAIQVVGHLRVCSMDVIRVAVQTASSLGQGESWDGKVISKLQESKFTENCGPAGAALAAVSQARELGDLLRHSRFGACGAALRYIQSLVNSGVDGTDTIDILMDNLQPFINCLPRIREIVPAAVRETRTATPIGQAFAMMVPEESMVNLIVKQLDELETLANETVSKINTMR